MAFLPLFIWLNINSFVQWIIVKKGYNIKYENRC